MRSMLTVTLFAAVLGFAPPLCAQQFTGNPISSCPQIDPIRFRLDIGGHLHATGSDPGHSLTVKANAGVHLTCNPGNAEGDHYCLQTGVMDAVKDITAEGYYIHQTQGAYPFDDYWQSNGNELWHVYYTQYCYLASGSYQVCNQGCGSSPLILPLFTKNSGNQVKLSDAAHGVLFDINGDGAAEQVAWPIDPETAGFLALDRDSDGLITSGKELFGDSTEPVGNNGFVALGKLRDNGPGLDGTGGLYEGQAYFTGEDLDRYHVLVWIDHNRDGIGTPDELEPASKYLVRINLWGEYVGKKDQNGNLYRAQGLVRFADKPAEDRPIYDVVLVIQQ